MASYNHSAIEKKWRQNWEKHPINVNDGKKPKYYCLGFTVPGRLFSRDNSAMQRSSQRYVRPQASLA